MVKCKTNEAMQEFEVRWGIVWSYGLRDVYLPSGRGLVIAKCNTYQDAMRFAIEARTKKEAK